MEPNTRVGTIDKTTSLICLPLRTQVINFNLKEVCKRSLSVFSGRSSSTFRGRFFSHRSRHRRITGSRRQGFGPVRSLSLFLPVCLYFGVQQNKVGDWYWVCVSRWSVYKYGSEILFSVSYFCVFLGYVPHSTRRGLSSEVIQTQVQREWTYDAQLSHDGFRDVPQIHQSQGGFRINKSSNEVELHQI